jgi:hypothetical protein
LKLISPSFFPQKALPLGLTTGPISEAIFWEQALLFQKEGAELARWWWYGIC